MKMLWDARALYIAAELQEPDVRGSVRGRDSVVFHDNDFEVFIDPDGDGLANLAEFAMNLDPLLAGHDLMPRGFLANDQCLF